VKISPQEIASVRKLSAFKRYSYLLKKLADWEFVTMLMLDGKSAEAKIDNHHVVPIWPAAKYASFEKLGAWSEYKIQQVSLDHFREMLSDFSNRKTLLSVFPTDGNSGFVVDCEEFTRDLAKELGWYE
jgi:hypothetical protein